MKKLRSIIYSLLLFILLTGLAISNNIKTVNTAELTKYRVGAECCDDSQSSATGRGACSHHGGVKFWKYNDGSVSWTGRCK